MTTPAINHPTQSTTSRAVWSIDAAHSLVEFSVRHMMIANVKGRFGEVKGTVVLDETDPTRSTVDVDIAAASIDTREAKRDAHLRSGDFFDTDRFPTIHFASRHIERSLDNTYRVTGDLTIRDITREVVLDVEDNGRGRSPWGQDVAAFSARTKVNRQEFGLHWNAALEAGGFLVGDDIKIIIEAELIRQS
jgi:polyisoprenoid-binding protein YceI